MNSSTPFSYASRFLVGVAVAVVCLQALLRVCLPFPLSFHVEGYTFADHLAIWIWRGTGSLRMLAYLLLAGWIGQLLQRTALGASRIVRIILIALSAIGLGLYVWGSYICYNPPYFLGGIIVSAMTLGLLLHPERINSHDTAALVILSLVLAVSFIALDNTAERHRWLDFPAALAFVYLMLQLAYAPAVQRLMGGRWVKPTILTLSILSVIVVLVGLLQTRSLSIYYLLPVWAVLIQPVVVYPFILLWRKRNEN